MPWYLDQCPKYMLFSIRYRNIIWRKINSSLNKKYPLLSHHFPISVPWIHFIFY